MKSLQKRLDSVRADVIQVYRSEGFLGIVRHGYARDFIAWEKWREENCPDVHFQPVPKSDNETHSPTDSQLLAKITARVATIESQNERLRLEIEQLRLELSGNDELLVIP